MGTTTWSKTLDADYTNSTYYYHARVVIKASDSTASGNRVRVRFDGHSTVTTTFKTATIGERSGSTEDFASAPTRLTFGGGGSPNDVFTVPAGGSIWSDWIDFAFDETKDYLVAWLSGNDYANFRFLAVAGQQTYWGYSTVPPVDGPEVMDWMPFSSSAEIWAVAAIEIEGTSQSATVSASATAGFSVEYGSSFSSSAAASSAVSAQLIAAAQMTSAAGANFAPSHGSAKAGGFFALFGAMQ